MKFAFLILICVFSAGLFAQTATDSVVYKSASYRELLDKMEEARFRAAQEKKEVQDGKGQKTVYVLSADEMKRLEKKYLKSFMAFYGINVEVQDKAGVEKKKNQKTQSLTTSHSGPGIALDENFNPISNQTVSDSTTADTINPDNNNIYYYTDAFGNSLVANENELLKNWKGFQFTHTTNLLSAKRSNTVVELEAVLDDPKSYIEITLERKERNADEFSQVFVLGAADILPACTGNLLKLTDRYPLPYQQECSYRLSGLTNFGAIIVFPPVDL